MPKVLLKTVHCLVPDESDKDEMYLKYNGEKIWPKENKFNRLDAGEKVEINLEMEMSEGWQEVELWDYDYISRNDLLGKFRFKVDRQIGEFNTSMTLLENGSPASYVLDWEIL